MEVTNSVINRGIVRDIASTHRGMRHQMASEILVYTASGKSQLPDGTKPLPGPMLIYHNGILTTTLQGELTNYSPEVLLVLSSIKSPRDINKKQSSSICFW